jgi:hypothetical protein
MREYPPRATDSGSQESETIKSQAIQIRRIRILLGLFVVGLILSGLTAIPLQTEIDLLQRSVGEGSPTESWWPALACWISCVHRGVTETSEKYPFLFYGTDWLAFAHFVIAIAFIGPLRDPVRNVWVVQFGMIACVLVIPTAFVFGPIRGIPLFWQLIDCSFGIIGIVPLYLAHRTICRPPAFQSKVA